MLLAAATFIIQAGTSLRLARLEQVPVFGARWRDGSLSLEWRQSGARCGANTPSRGYLIETVVSDDRFRHSVGCRAGRERGAAQCDVSLPKRYNGSSAGEGRRASAP